MSSTLGDAMYHPCEKKEATAHVTSSLHCICSRFLQLRAFINKIVHEILENAQPCFLHNEKKEGKISRYPLTSWQIQPASIDRLIVSKTEIIGTRWIDSPFFGNARSGESLKSCRWFHAIMVQIRIGGFRSWNWNAPEWHFIFQFRRAVCIDMRARFIRDFPLW